MIDTGRRDFLKGLLALLGASSLGCLDFQGSSRRAPLNVTIFNIAHFRLGLSTPYDGLYEHFDRRMDDLYGRFSNPAEVINVPRESLSPDQFIDQLKETNLDSYIKSFRAPRDEKKQEAGMYDRGPETPVTMALPDDIDKGYDSVQIVEMVEGETLLDKIFGLDDPQDYLVVHCHGAQSYLTHSSRYYTPLLTNEELDGLSGQEIEMLQESVRRGIILCACNAGSLVDSSVYPIAYNVRDVFQVPVTADESPDEIVQEESLNVIPSFDVDEAGNVVLVEPMIGIRHTAHFNTFYPE